MKKILAGLMAVIMLAASLSMASCKKKENSDLGAPGNDSVQTKPSVTSSPAVTEAPAHVDGKLADILAKVYEGSNIAGADSLQTVEITKDTFSYYLGADYVEGCEAIASEPAMSSVPHSVCLVRLPAGADTAAFVASVKEKANPRKWVCVEASNTIVDNIGDLVILIMTSFDAESIHSSFLALAK